MVINHAYSGANWDNCRDHCWGLTGIYYVLGIYKEIRKPPPEFVLQRFKESVDKPVKSDWSIRILHPKKPIEKCMVFYDKVCLPWWNKDVPYYERTIVAGGGGNVRIPVEIEKENAEVKIMDGKKTLNRLKFKDITASSRYTVALFHRSSFFS